METLSFHRAAVVLFAAVVLSGSALAQDPVAASSERAARQLLEDVEATYKAMPAYADQGEWRVQLVDGVAQGRVRTTFDRPSRLKLECDDVRFISDGTTLVTETEHGNEYKTTTTPATVDLRVFKNDDVWDTSFCEGRTAPPVFAVLALLCERDGVDVFLSHWGAKQLTLEGDRLIDGVTLKVILVKNTRYYDFRLFIEERSKRLLRMEITDHPPSARDRLAVELEGPTVAVPEAPKDDLRIPVKPQPLVLVWKAGTITNRRAPAAAFTYVPQDGFLQVKSFDRKQRDGDLRPVERLVGKSASDFMLMVREGLGGTHRLTKSDLRGKVVLLHFWSTRNVSSRESLERLPAAIVGKPEGLAVVSICQDDTPQHQSELERLRAMSPGGNRPKLPETFLRLDAIDPKKEIGNSFFVSELPTVLIIDGRGVVQYVLVGYNHQWSLFVKAALQQLLAKETLLCPPVRDVIVPRP